jgi:two-component system LytT family response regulator
MQLRTLIVDDEPVARHRLKRLLGKEADVSIVAECGDGASAASAIQKHDLDLVFLDVQMPKMSGFEVVSAVGADRMPAVIFVTAFDRFAMQAFEAQALDYLLKPFGEERVKKALTRARAFLTGSTKRSFQSQLTHLLNAAGNRHAQCLLVKERDRMIVLKPGEIDWVEAEGDYVRLHVGGDAYLNRITMAQMEARLAPEGFVRIHRSRLVNFERIKELRPMFRGESVVVLKNGARLQASDSCMRNLQGRFDDAI